MASGGSKSGSQEDRSPSCRPKGERLQSWAGGCLATRMQPCSVADSPAVNTPIRPVSSYPGEATEQGVGKRCAQLALWSCSHRRQLAAGGDQGLERAEVKGVDSKARQTGFKSQLWC